MKLFIILSILFLPSNFAFANNSTLNCSEYEFLVEGLDKLKGYDQSLKDELHREFVEATDPKCFS